MSYRYRALLLALSVLAPLPALLPAAAQTAPPEAARLLDQWDADGDGRVTLDEARAHRGRVFDTLDSDGDDDLTAAEIEALRARFPDRRGDGSPRQDVDLDRVLGLMDADGDGRLSRAEYMAATPRWFERRDTDGDGLLTGAELGR